MMELGAAGHQQRPLVMLAATMATAFSLTAEVEAQRLPEAVAFEIVGAPQRDRDTVALAGDVDEL
jgi:hypothetical protein